MKTLNILISNKKATYSKRDGVIVCGNSGYQIQFIFDPEWSEFKNKTARFKWNGKYTDIDFEGDICPVPIVSNTERLEVGVFVDRLATTTSAKIPCKRSILCGSEVEQAPGQNEEPQVQVKTQTKEITATENGAITVEPDDGYLLGQVNVDVAVYPNLQDKIATENGEVFADPGYYGLNKVTVNVPEKQIALEEIEIISNGVHYPHSGYEGFSSVTVNVPLERIPDGYVKPEGLLDITENGMHDVTHYQYVAVDVGGGASAEIKEYTLPARIWTFTGNTTGDYESLPYPSYNVSADISGSLNDQSFDKIIISGYGLGMEPSNSVEGAPYPDIYFYNGDSLVYHATAYGMDSSFGFVTTADTQVSATFCIAFRGVFG